MEDMRILLEALSSNIGETMFIAESVTCKCEQDEEGGPNGTSYRDSIFPGQMVYGYLADSRKYMVLQAGAPRLFRGHVIVWKASAQKNIPNVFQNDPFWTQKLDRKVPSKRASKFKNAVPRYASGQRKLYKQLDPWLVMIHQQKALDITDSSQRVLKMLTSMVPYKKLLVTNKLLYDPHDTSVHPDPSVLGFYAVGIGQRSRPNENNMKD